MIPIKMSQFVKSGLIYYLALYFIEHFRINNFILFLIQKNCLKIHNHFIIVIYRMEKNDKIVILKLKKITIVSLIFMSVELCGGYFAHSIAIMADAFHLLSDVFAYVISLYAVLLSYKKAPKYLAFGY
jgi:Co/Zn/Cd efflux system component